MKDDEASGNGASARDSAELSKIELARLVVRGDPWAFQIIALRVRPSLVRYAARLGASPGDLDQIVDVALDRAEDSMRLDGFDPSRSRARDPVASWLMGFVRNTCRSFYRRHPRTVPLPSNAEDVFVGGSGSDHTEVENAVLTDLVKSAASTLDKRSQKVLLLRTDKELSFRDISLKMNITEDNARQLFHRALTALRRAIKLLQLQG